MKRADHVYVLVDMVAGKEVHREFSFPESEPFAVPSRACMRRAGIYACDWSLLGRPDFELRN
jgi:hypothetical protein